MGGSPVGSAQEGGSDSGGGSHTVLAEVSDVNALMLELCDPGRWAWQPSPPQAHTHDPRGALPTCTAHSIAAAVRGGALGAQGGNAIVRVLWAVRRAMVGIVACMESEWMQSVALCPPPHHHHHQPQKQHQQQQQDKDLAGYNGSLGQGHEQKQQEGKDLAGCRGGSMGQGHEQQQQQLQLQRCGKGSQTWQLPETKECCVAWQPVFEAQCLPHITLQDVSGR